MRPTAAMVQTVFGEEEWEDDPGEAVVEVVDQACLAGAAQGAVAPGGTGEDGPRGAALAGGQGLGVAGEFQGDVGRGVAHDQGERETGTARKRTPSSSGTGRRPWLVARKPVSRAAAADGEVAGGLVEPIASPRWAGPTRSIFMFTVMDQVRPWLTPSRTLAATIQPQEVA